MKLFLLFILCLTIIGLLDSKAQTTVYTQTFDDAWTNCNAPNGWTSDVPCGDVKAWHRNDVTTGWDYSANASPSITGYNNSFYYARFHTYGITGGMYSELISETFNLLEYTNTPLSLSFYYIN